MDRRHRDSHARSRAMFEPSAYSSHKGSASRQQENEQTKTLPGSNIEKERQHRRKVDLLSVERPRDNAKLESFEGLLLAEKKKRIAKHKKRSDFFCVHHNENFSHHQSDNEQDLKSLLSGLSGDSEVESDSEDSDALPFENIEEGLERLTKNYIREVKSQVTDAITKLKSKEKLNPMNKVKSKEKLGVQSKFNKKSAGGAGDTKGPRIGFYSSDINAAKSECYRKIEANLEMLKNIDTVTDQILRFRSSYDADI